MVSGIPPVRFGQLIVLPDFQTADTETVDGYASATDPARLHPSPLLPQVKGAIDEGDLPLLQALDTAGLDVYLHPSTIGGEGATNTFSIADRQGNRYTPPAQPEFTAFEQGTTQLISHAVRVGVSYLAMLYETQRAAVAGRLPQFPSPPAGEPAQDALETLVDFPGK